MVKEKTPLPGPACQSMSRPLPSARPRKTDTHKLPPLLLSTMRA